MTAAVSREIVESGQRAAERSDASAGGETRKATFKVWRGDATAGSSRFTRRGVARAWSCSTPSIRSRRRAQTIWPCAGTARPANAGRVRPKSTGCRS